MPNRPKQSQVEFAETFNRLLGDKIGRPTSAPSPVNISPEHTFTATDNFNVLQSIMAESEKVRGSSAAPPGPTLTKEQRRELDDQRMREVLQQVPDDNHNPWWKRAIDVIARPVYAGHGALTEGARALADGEPFWSIGDDIAYGNIRGLAGKENPDTGNKYGFGDMTDQFKREDIKLHGLTEKILQSNHFTKELVNANQYYGAVDRNPNLDPGKMGLQLPGTRIPGLDWKTPDLNLSLQNLNRAVGFTGEAFIDPYLGVGGKVLKIASESGEILNAQKLARMVEKAAEEAVNAQKAKLPSASVKNPKTGMNTFVNAAEQIGKEAGDALDKAVLQITGGGQGGKLKFDPRTIIPAIANVTAEAYRKARLSKFEKNLAAFMAHVDGTKPLTKAQVQKLVKSDPLIRRFHQEALDIFNANRKNKINDIDVLFKIIQARGTAVSSNVAIRRALENTRRTIEKEVQDVLEHVQKGMANSTYGAPGIRFGSKVIPFKRVGRAYQFVNNKIDAKFPGVRDFRLPFSYEAKYPGRLSLLSQKTRGMGIKAFDELATVTRKRARQISKADRETIARAIDSDTVLADPKLEAERLWIKEQYRIMFMEEKGMGARALKQAHADDYQYVRLRGGSKEAREKFRAQRKAHLQATGRLDGYRAADARALGLRPVTDPYEALLLRKMDSNNTLAKAWFKGDLLDHYGIFGKKLSREEIAARDLVQLKTDRLPATVSAGVGKDESWYLPRVINEVLEDMTKVTNMDDKDMHAILNIFDYITSKFKTLVTVPYPGFHVRNMIGDVFMGYLDGVRFSTYKELIVKGVAWDKMRTRLGRKPPTFKIANGVELTRDELVDLYVRNAASGGFYSTDLGKGVKAVPSRINAKLRDVSEAREDFGRLAHFLHALRDEYPNQVVRGKNRTLMESAVEASVYRVNKYKFDYSALTAFERKGIKRVIPFYTYTRKAFPTLLEAMFLTPKNMERISRITEKLGGDGENFSGIFLPDHIRELGYVTLKDEENPWILESSFMPHSVLGTMAFDQNINEGARSLVGMMSPLAKGLPELAFQKEAFNNAPIDDNLEYLLKQIGPVGPTQGLSKEGKTATEKILSNRWFFGLPFRQISDGQMNFRVQQLKDSNIDYPFRAFNREFSESHGVRVYMSSRNDGLSFRVKNERTGDVIGDYQTPEMALTAARRLVQG